MQMVRTAAGALILGVVLLTTPGAVAAVPVTVRDSVVIADDVVRLGDLFQNISGREAEPVATAPAPGDRIVFDNDQLFEIARTNGIDWQPRGRGERVLVERSSRVVDAPQLQRQLARAIADKKPGRDVEVELETRIQPIHLPIGTAFRIRFEDVMVDTDRASATLVTPTGDGRENRTVVAGKLYPVVDVPVLARPMMPTEQIVSDDVEWVKLRSSRLRQGVTVDVQQIVGRMPRRPLNPGVPLSVRDLQERVVVSKNSQVTIVLQVPNMTLTTRGKALEDGASGAAIRVLSSSGDRAIEATVLGPDVVQVKPAQSIAAFMGRNK